MPAMRIALLLLALAACRGGDSPRSADCALIDKDPSGAVAALTQKYPEQPVKVAETIERCVAPDGPPCDRVAKIVKAIPDMMPGGFSGERPGGDLASVCRSAPPAMQRCMLPSYTLTHTDECAKVLEDMRRTPIQSLDIKP